MLRPVRIIYQYLSLLFAAICYSLCIFLHEIFAFRCNNLIIAYVTIILQYIYDMEGKQYVTHITMWQLWSFTGLFRIFPMFSGQKKDLVLGKLFIANACRLPFMCLNISNHPLKLYTKTDLLPREFFRSATLHLKYVNSSFEICQLSNIRISVLR